MARFDRTVLNTNLNTLRDTTAMMALMPLISAEYDDCEVTVLIERRKKSRSKDQLAYYWGVVLPEIANHTGHDVDELHEIFKSKYLRKKRFWRDTTLTTISSTSTLTLKEMSNFIKLVIREANEMEIEIPPSSSEISYTQ
jgi:hypothetical protein